MGILAKQREKIANGLSYLHADTYALYLKTHNHHWIVTGPMFNTLHLMFETQDTELAGAVDLYAERIRVLEVPAPGSYAQFSKLLASTITIKPWKPCNKVSCRSRAIRSAAHSSSMPRLRPHGRRGHGV